MISDAQAADLSQIGKGHGWRELPMENGLGLGEFLGDRGFDHGSRWPGIDQSAAPKRKTH